MSRLSIYKNRLQQSYKQCSNFWERMIDDYKHYFGKLVYKDKNDNDIGTGRYPFSSRVSTSISYDVVETVLPRIIGRDPEFITAGVEPSDVPYEDIAKMVITSQYENPKLYILGEPIYLKLQKMVKEALITGNAVGRCFWRKETVKRAVYKGKIADKVGDIDEMEKLAEKLGAKMSFVKEYENMPFLDDFDLKHLPFFFFFPDPSIPETGRMRYKIERDFYTKDELISEAEMFGYDKAVLKEVFEKGRGGFTPDLSKDFMYQYNELFSSLSDETFSTDNDKVPLYIVDKMWDNGRVYVFVNEAYNLTGEEGIPSPYDLIRDPFIFAYDNLIPHSYFGRGEIAPIKKLEDAINDFTNMRADNLYKAMSSVYLVNPVLFEGGGDNFIPTPNSVWQVKDITLALREVKGQDVTSSIYKEIDVLYQYIQRISGVTDYVKGSEGMTLAGRTYGGLRLAQEVANIRFFIKGTQFEQITLRALGYMMLEMARQFLDEDRVVRIVGEDNIKSTQKIIKVSDLKKIRGFMDIKIIPSSTRAVDEQAEAMKLNGLLDRMSSGRPPFDKMTPSLYGRFLMKYLPLFGFHDALHWVRRMGLVDEEIKEKKDEEKKPDVPLGNVKDVGDISKQMPPMPVSNEEMITSSGIQQQPNPLQQILANQTEMLNQVPIQNII